MRERWARPGSGLQTPVAHLVCNFAPPVDGRPALLTHDDVQTLFHEFGHGLHHMLTQVDDLGVSGISGVEWDAVELPSQFMENFCWEWEVLQRLTAHVDSGEPLPRHAVRPHAGGQELPQRAADAAPGRVFAVRHAAARRTRQRVAHRRARRRSTRRGVAGAPPAFNRFQHSFSHIFAGGYAAGYYSYKWAEVLSADAWSAFEEAATTGSVLDMPTGRRYRRAVLEAGGSRSAMESFKTFRGREPRIDALLRHQGLDDGDTPAA
jgi:oligopeptidase A